MRRALAVAVLTAGIIAGAAAPALATTANVGGGTWNYGTGVAFPALETVYSNYYHPTNHHSGTSVCSANNVTVHASAGNWANSNTSCGIVGASTHAYWNNND